MGFWRTLQDYLDPQGAILAEERNRAKQFIRHLENIKRCTCPGTPGSVRRSHETWCPWDILRVARTLVGAPPE